MGDCPAPPAVALEVDLPAQLPLDVAQDVRHLLLFDVAAAEMERRNQGRRETWRVKGKGLRE